MKTKLSHPCPPFIAVNWRKKTKEKKKKMFIFFSYLSQAETNQEMEESTPKAFGHLVWGGIKVWYHVILLKFLWSWVCFGAHNMTHVLIFEFVLQETFGYVLICQIDDKFLIFGEWIWVSVMVDNKECGCCSC